MKTVSFKYELIAEVVQENVKMSLGDTANNYDSYFKFLKTTL